MSLSCLAFKVVGFRRQTYIKEVAAAMVMVLRIKKVDKAN